MSKELTHENSRATVAVDTGKLLQQLLTLINSNMKGDGEFTKDQINNHAKLTSVAIRVVELELKLNKAVPHSKA